jgi:hypothetical protein
MFGLSGGRNMLVGDTSRLLPGTPGLLMSPSTTRVAATSREGHLLVERMLSEQTAGSVARRGAPARPVDAFRVSVTERSAATGAAASGTLTQATAPDAAPATVMGAPIAVPGAVRPAAYSNPACAVPRNDVTRQALQPSTNMVEWAVDQAVNGALNIARPANYLHTGEPAYTPQGLFPAPTSVKVPAQVLLGILAQETNVAQASWHAVPGDTGNPLVADYYGNAGLDQYPIDYSSSDCGYGVGQVTDGMRADGSFSNQQQVAVATDYAANIAASLQILAGKWTQTKATGTTANDADPRYVENWWFALWGYNSGVYPNDGSNNGHYGVGWLNNPANPQYPADRHPFIRGTNYDDASHPADWSYVEKVMGWIEQPQWDGSIDVRKYSAPDFGSDAQQLTLPDRMAFCSPTVNNCDPTADDTTDPCPDESDACWWHGNRTWTQCPVNCAQENLAYLAGSSQPALRRTYPLDCSVFPTPSGSTGTPLVVDNLYDSAANAQGCPAGNHGGKFDLLLADPVNDGYGVPNGSVLVDGNPSQKSLYAQIDLHQLGAGYLGHSWFTHEYAAGGTYAIYHQVTGVWVPDITQAGRYWVQVHLPNHGAATHHAVYHIRKSATPLWFDPDAGSEPGSVVNTCEVDQGAATGATSGSNAPQHDAWVSLGTYDLAPGAEVQLHNTENSAVEGAADGTADVSYDAVAFIPVPAGTQEFGCGITVG